MKLDLAYYGNPVLRKKAKVISNITKEVKSFVFNMIETMDNEKNGIGLAANQVGSLLKVFVIRSIIKTDDDDYAVGDPEIYINPKLAKVSDEMEIMSEGCLSFPGLHIDIKRPKKIHIEALDIDGKEISYECSGFKARQIMHENDHLNGVLCIDRMQDGKKKNVLDPILRKIKKKYN